jgi:hypothetical protein
MGDHLDVGQDSIPFGVARSRDDCSHTVDVTGATGAVAAAEETVILHPGTVVTNIGGRGVETADLDRHGRSRGLAACRHLDREGIAA